MSCRSVASLTVAAVVSLAAVLLPACSPESSAGATGKATESGSAAVVRPDPALLDRLAQCLVQASPMADPADPAARDAASVQLGTCADLQAAAGHEILWGGFDEKRGYDPAVNNLTLFSSYVWARLYLSTLMFSGDYTVHDEGEYTVLELAARFRDRLDPGEYPYPFWHSAQKWAGYVDAAAVLLVFQGDHIVVAYRKPVHDPSRPVAAKEWDGKWQWVDADGQLQPRVDLFTYVLSPDNPHRETLDTAYRNLEERFRKQECVSCHAPDNSAKAKQLAMLCFPNQALAVRDRLVEVLAEDKMPPLDPDTGREAGLHDDTARNELVALAQAFREEADAALAFETDRVGGSQPAAR